MQEKREFLTTKIPEKNPNKTNDIYKKNGSQHAVVQLVCLLTASVIATIICTGFWIDSICTALSPEGRTDDYVGFLLIGVVVIAAIIWVKVNVKDLYLSYGYRKKIMANGNAYPGVIGEVQEYDRKPGEVAYVSLMSWKKYSVEVKYAEGSFGISDLEADPRACLENPYCTVYVWNGKAIATDFKVREEYIAPNGKTYLAVRQKK